MNYNKTITAVGVIRIVDLDKMSLVGDKFADVQSAQPKMLAIKVPASMTVANKEDDGNQIFTTTLKFNTCEELSVYDRLAFIAHTVEGKRLLVGTNTRPYTTVSCEYNHPGKASDNQLTEVTVSYSSTHGPLQIV